MKNCPLTSKDFGEFMLENLEKRLGRQTDMMMRKKSFSQRNSSVHIQEGGR